VTMQRYRKPRIAGRRVRRGRGGFQPFRAAIRRVQSAVGVSRRTTQLAGVTQRPRAAAAAQMSAGDGNIVKTWVANGTPFSMLDNGKIVVTRKDGTMKTYRPYRPVVIPRKWNARSMGRVATALKGMRKTAGKIMQLTGGYPGAGTAKALKAVAAAEEKIHHGK